MWEGGLTGLDHAVLPGVRSEEIFEKYLLKRLCSFFICINFKTILPYKIQFSLKIKKNVHVFDWLINTNEFHFMPNNINSMFCG